MILAGHEMGKGKPVILLHGLFGSSRNFGVVQRRLAARFRVIALDLRNHGESPHIMGMDYPAMAADVLETLQTRDIGSARLIGHSMGGKIAMATALAAPDAVEMLVVVDISPVRYRSSFHAYVEAMRSVPLAPGLTRAAAAEYLATAVPERATRNFLLQNLGLGQAPAWRIGLKEIADALPSIEGWAVPERRYGGPTVFVAGERSSYIRLEHRPVIRAHFPAARFATVKSTGHWVHAENPEGFLAVLSAILA